MTYDTYRIIFYIAIVLAPFFFLISVLLFFVLKIPECLGIISGRTDRKAVEEIRNRIRNGIPVNSSDNVRKHKKERASEKAQPQSFDSYGKTIMTSKLKTGQLANAAMESYQNNYAGDGSGNVTTTLNEDVSNQTTDLNDQEQGGISFPSQNQYMETTELNYSNSANQWQTDYSDFVVEYELIFIHTNEVIC